jgi:hypothetical protein
MNEQLNATGLWCNLTNALIKKYKIMSQEDSNKAYAELILLRNCLLNNGFLTIEDMNERDRV